MIPRYEVEEISNIWSDRHKFETYLKVEIAILEAIEGSYIPKGVANEIAKKAIINPERIDEIEKTTKHDVIAFCTSITENLDPKIGKFFHFGVTSSDIIDTSFMMLIKESLELVLAETEKLSKTLKASALKYKELISMGRSHGIYAEPMSFGQKFLSFYHELQRREQDLKFYYENQITGQVSGAVGNYTVLDRDVELKALKKLGLKREPLSTQIIPRDRIAQLVCFHGLLASFIERVAVEIRHLHRSDVGEVFEGFSKGQKGSSIMPHKKNPISGENLTGIARVLRSHVQLSLENCVLWHERDISHSSAERLFLPDNFGLMVYALRRLNSTIENLVVNEEVVEARVHENYTYLSSFYLHKLLEQIDISREDCYAIIQKASFDSQSATEFHNIIISEVETRGFKEFKVQAPTKENLKAVYLKEIDKIFDIK